MKCDTHLEEVDGGCIDVADRGQVNDDELQGSAVGGCGLLRSPLVLVQGLFDGVDIRKIQGGVHSQQQHALHLASLWILLDVPAALQQKQSTPWVSNWFSKQAVPSVNACHAANTCFDTG